MFTNLESPARTVKGQNEVALKNDKVDNGKSNAVDKLLPAQLSLLDSVKMQCLKSDAFYDELQRIFFNDVEHSTSSTAKGDMTPLYTQQASIPLKDEMNTVQLNEYIAGRSNELVKFEEERRRSVLTGGVISDIHAPFCFAGMPVKLNIDNLFARFKHNLNEAIFFESEYIKIFNDFETLKNIVGSERELIFKFLKKNGLSDKFGEFVRETKKSKDVSLQD